MGILGGGEVSCIVVGDIHGDWGKLNQLISQKKPSIILQCGDFGWWPKMEVTKPVLYGRQKQWDLMGVKPHGTKVYWCDGNHEQHEILPQRGEIQEMYENVFFCQRGSTMRLDDGRVVLFAGGADSIDKDMRTAGHDWFSAENITEKQFDMIMSHERVDIVISHTSPESFDVAGSEGKIKDVNRIALDAVLEKYSPDLWYFGHWHKAQSGKHKNTRWRCLDYPGHGGDVVDMVKIGMEKYNERQKSQLSRLDRTCRGSADLYRGN